MTAVIRNFLEAEWPKFCEAKGISHPLPFALVRPGFSGFEYPVFAFAADAELVKEFAEHVTAGGRFHAFTKGSVFLSPQEWIGAWSPLTVRERPKAKLLRAG